MGYSLVPYQIDLHQLRAAVGSKDLMLLEGVLAQKNHQTQLDADDADAPLTVRKALTQLVMAEPLGNRHTHQYGYALEPLANFLGKPLKLNLWCGVRWAALENSGLEPHLQSGPPVPLPPIDDFPFISLLARDQVADLLKPPGNKLLTQSHPDLQELMDEFKGWLEQAASANHDLLFFYY